MVQEEIIIYQKCPQCAGTGMHRPASGSGAEPAEPCNWLDCNGTGFISFGKIDLSDIIDKCNDILDKCGDIFEKLNE